MRSSTAWPEAAHRLERSEQERLCDDAVSPVIERFGVVPTLRATSRYCERVAERACDAAERWIHGYAARRVAVCGEQVVRFVRRENERAAFGSAQR